MGREFAVRINSDGNGKLQEASGGIVMSPGDVLAVVRKGGLYLHYGVYIGDGKVIHYAAENSDFSGKISVHEAPLEEFKRDSSKIYVLDFDQSGNLPVYRNLENPVFELIRVFGYHLYTPEETVERAKSRIGETKYSLSFNNCEHFAIWCKTGVKESHQVNIWISRIIDAVKRELDTERRKW